MEEALLQAELAAKNNEVPIGAVVSIGEKIVAKRYNETESQNSPCAHAEILAIQDAAKTLSNWRLTECALTVTVEPCTMCVGAILQARIPLVIFGCSEPLTGALGSRWDLSLNENGEQNFRIIRNIQGDKATSLMQSFFKKQRTTSST